MQDDPGWLLLEDGDGTKQHHRGRDQGGREQRALRCKRHNGTGRQEHAHDKQDITEIPVDHAGMNGQHQSGEHRNRPSGPRGETAKTRRAVGPGKDERHLRLTQGLS